MISLGVGVVFESLDKGLKKDMFHLNKSFIQAKKNIDGLQKSASALKIDAFSGNSEVQKGLDNLNKKIDDFGDKLDNVEIKPKKVKKSLTDMGMAALETFSTIATGLVTQSGMIRDAWMGKFELNQLAKDLDAVNTQFRMIGDNKSASVFMSNMQVGMKQFGVSATQMNDIFGSLSQFTMTTKDLNDSFAYTNKLVGGLKMNAADVADMFGRASNTFDLLPGQMFKTVAETNRLGAAFGMINFGQDIPGMFEQATKNAMMLGDTSKGSVLSATNSIAKLATSFKAAGMSSKDAIAASKGFSGNLSKMALDIKRMNLGLGYNQELMNGIGKAASFAGVGFDEFTQDIQKNDPDAIIQKYGTIIQQMQKAGQNVAAEQLRFSLGDLFGDDVLNALGNVDRMKGNIGKASKRAKALSPGDKLLEEQIALNRSSLEMSQRVVDSNKALVAANIDLAAKSQIVSESFKQAFAYGEMANTALSGAFTFPRMIELAGISNAFSQEINANILKLVGYAESYGKALAVIAGGFGVFKLFGKFLPKMGPFFGKGGMGGGLLGRAAGGAKTLGKGVFSMGGKAAGMMGNAAGKVVGLGGKALGVFSKLAGPLGVLWSFVDDIIDSIGDFGNQGVLGGIGTILFGKTAADGGGTFGKMISQMFKWGAVGALGGPVGIAIGALVGGIGSLLKDSFTNGFAETFGGLGKTLWSGIVSIFDVNTYKNIWEKIKSAWTGMIGWFTDMINKPAETISKTLDKLQSLLPSWLGGKEVASAAVPQAAKPYQASDYKVPSSPMVLAPTPAAVAKTSMNQPNAPANAALGTASQPTMASTTGTSNDMLIKKLDEINANLNSISAANINVNVMGDLKKFLTVVASTERQKMAVGPSGQSVMPAGTTG